MIGEKGQVCVKAVVEGQGTGTGLVCNGKNTEVGRERRRHEDRFRGGEKGR